MKKIVLLLGLITSSAMFAQVGINTPTPTSTLDVTAKNATGTTTNTDGLLVPRVDRQRAQSMTGTPTSTLIYVNSIATGTAAGTTVNVDAVGYYYFNGTVWVKLHNPANIPNIGVNIYNADGTLTGNRTVIQGANTLTFNSTAINGFSVDGSTFSVDAANNRIGIGTTAPAGILNISSDNIGANAGNDVYFRGYGNSKAAGFFIGAANGTEAIPENLITGDEIGGYYLSPRINNSWIHTSAGMRSSYRGDGTTNLTDLQLFTSTSEKMRITETGDVGIGTTAPARLLHVAGNARITGSIGTPTDLMGRDANGDISNITLGSGFSLIGGTLSSTATGTNIYNSNGTLTGNRVVTQGTNTLAFNTDAVNGFSVAKTGVGYILSVNGVNSKVGIGTTTPSGRLTVSGNGGSLTPILSLTNTNVTNNPTLNIYPGYTSNVAGITEGNQYAVVFDQDPGISNVAATQSLYDFHGQVRYVNASALSDRRLKDNIRDLNEYGLTQVMKLQPKRYIMKASNSPDVGLIAQELKAVVPEIVYGDEKNGLLSVDYSKISLVLINAIKEQQKIIEKQGQDIEQLKTEIKNLKNKNY